MQVNKIYNENCLTGLKNLPDNSIDCCVTSPPYFGLRDYGTSEQIGLEETPEIFVSALVEVFTEVKRVLKDDGTLWLNLGDSYAGNNGSGSVSPGDKQSSNSGSLIDTIRNPKKIGLKQKDLIGIPWMVAFALRSSGWYLRQDIIWNKPNPMPESVTDRCTKSHEYIFLLSKSAKYFYDHEAIKTPIADSSVQRLSQDVENQKGSERVPGKTNGRMKAVAHKSAVTPGQSPSGKALNRMNGITDPEYLNANKRSVWTVTTKPFKEAHFATFPEDLILDCIKAGCPFGGTVLDPFMGAGTTALVARKLDRNYIGFELNPEYIAIAEKRLQDQLGFFK